MAINIKPEQAYAYAEILDIINNLDPSLSAKIPQKLILIFNTYASKDYVRHIKSEIPLEQQGISPKTAALLALLTLRYLCENESQKSSLRATLTNNQKAYDAALREKYNPDNIFASTSVTNSNDIVPELISDSSSLPVDYNSLPWYKKLFTNIKKFVYKLFKKENNPT